jgi:hypothetical protein
LVWGFLNSLHNYNQVCVSNCESTENNWTGKTWFSSQNIFAIIIFRKEK